MLQLVGTTANGNVKTLTNLQFMLGFSQHQISQVLNNLPRIFSIADIYKLVEIWHRRHAQRILVIFRNVFGDVNVDIEAQFAVGDTDSYEFDDDLLDEWNEFLEDGELYEMIVDNLSLSQLQSSGLEDKTTMAMVPAMMMLWHQQY